MVLVGIEGVYLAERVKRLSYVEPLPLLWSEEPKKLVVLGSKFKNGANSDYYVVEVGFIEGFTLPLVLFTLYFPKLTSQLGHTVLPAAADAHALIKLDTDVRVRRLPNVVFFKFTLNAPANHLRGHPE